MRTAAGLLLPVVTPVSGILINENVYRFIDNAFAVFMLLMALGFLTGLIARGRSVIVYTGLVAIGWWFLWPVISEPAGPSRTSETQHLMMYLAIVCAPVMIGTAVGVEMATIDDKPKNVPSA